MAKNEKSGWRPSMGYTNRPKEYARDIKGMNAAP